MFHKHFEKVKRRQKAQTRNKIIIFSLLSSTISALFALFLSKKENRDKIIETSKKITEKGKEKGTTAFQKARERGVELSKVAREKFDKVSTEVKSRMHKNSYEAPTDNEIKLIEVKDEEVEK